MNHWTGGGFPNSLSGVSFFILGCFHLLAFTFPLGMLINHDSFIILASRDIFKRRVSCPSSPSTFLSSSSNLFLLCSHVFLNHLSN
jgi:hypothetical protein